MPHTQDQIRITGSVFDRLLGETCAARQGDDLGALKQSVLRDLNWLLNTRQSANHLPPELEAANQSLLTYGLPDFAHFSLNNNGDRESVRQAMEGAISRFEPRLDNVRVVLREATEGKEKEAQQQALISLSIEFVVMALLKVEPTPVPVVFDTVLDLRSGKYEVKEQ